MVKDRLFMSCPTEPEVKAMGKNTATVVRVDAVTAMVTSFVPVSAASLGS